MMVTLARRYDAQVLTFADNRRSLWLSDEIGTIHQGCWKLDVGMNTETRTKPAFPNSMQRPDHMSAGGIHDRVLAIR